LQSHQKAHLHTCNTQFTSLQLYRVVPKQMLIHSKLPSEIYKLSPVTTYSWSCEDKTSYSFKLPQWQSQDMFGTHDSILCVCDMDTRHSPTE
jgi:hypothetical protein